MDIELSNAFGWLASNYERWEQNESDTAIVLRSFFTRQDPQPDEQNAWASSNREELLNLYAESSVSLIV
jgi:hypothetical protein